MPELEQNIGQALADVSELRLALLFGSRAKGTAKETSDIDLAVDAPEAQLGAIGARVSEALGLEVDTVRLAGASIPLLRELVRDSVVVFEATPGAAALWRSRTLAQLEIDGPWYDRMRDAWIAAVAKRGFNNGQQDLLALKLTELSERCGRVRSHVPASVAELAADGDALDLVAFNLMLGLRNIVAHGYAGLDVASCHSAATRGLVDLEAFAQQVSSWVNRSS